MNLQVGNMLIDLKAHAEALILDANDIDGVLTCSLRPSNVFGPGDTEIVPYFLKLARYGFTKVHYFASDFFLVNSCKLIFCLLNVAEKLFSIS